MDANLDDRQWQRFVRRDWCRRATWRRGVGALVGSSELFEVVAAASSAGDGRTQFRQYVNGRPLEEQSLLPHLEDESFAGWRRRMARQFRGSVALVVNPLQHHSHWLWQRLSEFLRGLFERTGIPPYGVEVGAFIGDYDANAAPFGVHTDAVDVVVSMIEGRKRIVTWRPDQLTSKQAKRYGRSRALPPPTIVDAEPGDLVYWPSGFWHTAECRGFSVSLNIALGVRGGTPSNDDPLGTPSSVVGAAFRDLTNLGRSDQATALRLGNGRVRGLTPVLRRRLDRAASVVAEGGLERRLLGDQLARVTGFGFVPAPPLGEKVRLRREARLRVNPAVPIARGLSGNWLVLAAGGRAWSIPAHPALIALPARLAARGGRTVGELLEPFPATVHERGGDVTVTDRAVRRLLESLCRARALVVVDGEGAR